MNYRTVQTQHGDNPIIDIVLDIIPNLNPIQSSKEIIQYLLNEFESKLKLQELSLFKLCPSTNTFKKLPKSLDRIASLSSLQESLPEKNHIPLRTSDWRRRLKSDSKDRAIPTNIGHAQNLELSKSIIFKNKLTGMIYSKYRKNNANSTEIKRSINLLAVVIAPYLQDIQVSPQNNIYWHRFLKLIRKDKIFLDDRISVVRVANQLEISSKYLSRIIGNQSNTNFNAIINEARINYFIKIIHSRRSTNVKLLELAYESGFSSKATFNRAFKNFMSCTPSEYLANYISDYG